MNRDELDAAKARADAATPGPWWTEPTSDGRNIESVYGMVRKGRPNGEGIITCTYYGHSYDSAANAEFVAHARTDLPAALKQIDDLLSLVLTADRLLVLIECAEDFLAREEGRNVIVENTLAAAREAFEAWRKLT